MERHGSETTSQSLWDQIEAAANVLQPSYEAIGTWLLAQPLLHVDETGWPVNALDTGRGAQDAGDGSCQPAAPPPARSEDCKSYGFGRA